jgi:hypothetical protein
MGCCRLTEKSDFSLFSVLKVELVAVIYKIAYDKTTGVRFELYSMVERYRRKSRILPMWIGD